MAFFVSSNAFRSAALCFASAASLRAAAAALFNSSTLLALLMEDSDGGVTDLVEVGVLVTSEVPKNDENASVTGSCGSLLICLGGEILSACGLDGVDFVSVV